MRSSHNNLADLIVLDLDFLLAKGNLLPEAWTATPPSTQRAIIAVMAMGPKATFETLDLGPPREILHAEALSLVVALGPVSLCCASRV